MKKLLFLSALIFVISYYLRDVYDSKKAFTVIEEVVPAKKDESLKEANQQVSTQKTSKVVTEASNNKVKVDDTIENQILNNSGGDLYAYLFDKNAQIPLTESMIEATQKRFSVPLPRPSKNAHHDAFDVEVVARLGILKALEQYTQNASKVQDSALWKKATDFYKSYATNHNNLPVLRRQVLRSMASVPVIFKTEEERNTFISRIDPSILESSQLSDIELLDRVVANAK